MTSAPGLPRTPEPGSKALKKAGTDPRAPERLEAAQKRYAALGYEPKRLGRLAELWDRLNAMGVSLKNLEAMVTQARRHFSAQSIGQTPRTVFSGSSSSGRFWSVDFREYIAAIMRPASLA